MSSRLCNAKSGPLPIKKTRDHGPRIQLLKVYFIDTYLGMPIKKKIIWIYSMFRRVGVYFQLPQVHFHNPNSGPDLPNMEGTNTHHNWRPKEPTQLRPWKKRTRPGVLLRPNLHQWSPSGVGDKSTQEHQICISFRF